MPMPPLLPIPIISSLIVILSILPTLPALPVLPNPDPATIHHHQQQQPFHPTSSPPATIPSFPEQQSAVAGCPLHLPDELFPSVKHFCSPGKHGQLHKGMCCPVLATWLYSAYSDTALGKLKAKQTDPTKTTSSSSSYEMPLLPDDSETCVDGLEKSMRDKGIDLVRPNASCDVVYCFCGIRLHPLSCPQAFSFSEDGNLIAGHRVKNLETDCLSNGGAANNGFTSLSKCSKCLNSLYKLKSGRGNKTKSDGRTSKMRSRDCELMGLTWLLNKNRDAYLSTVTAVMRALMMNKPGSDPLSCSVSSDGMPLAVDSIQFDDQSSSVALHFPLHLLLFLMMFLLLIFSHLVLVLPNSF